MAHRTSLDIGKAGFVSPRQLWLVNAAGGPLLYVEPRFTERIKATPGMLRVTHEASRQGLTSFYAILLPAPGQFSVTHTIAELNKGPRGMIKVRRIYIPPEKAGEPYFPTIPQFYFHKA